MLGQRDALLDTAGHDDTAPGDNDGKLGLREQLGRLVQTLLSAGATLELPWRRNFDVDFTVKEVARNVQLRGTSFGQRHVEAARRNLGHPAGPVYMTLILGDA